MNRSLLAQIGLVMAVSLTGLVRPAAADTDPTLKIVLQIPDGSVPLHVVIRAKSEVTRIYREAGVAITWKGVASSTGRSDALRSTEASAPGFGLVILSDKFTDQLIVATDALGGATGTREQPGQIAYVFYDRVESIARAYLNRGQLLGTYEVDTVIVLAHAMAHEIGHLLLPHGHSDVGLMRADWNAADLRDAAGGRLNFTAEQAAFIRARLVTRNTSSNADGS
jgi:type IV pilus biogenesis protein CpaD/CtpE